MSNRETLEELRDVMESWIILMGMGPGLLLRLVDQALATPAPEGSPGTLRDLAGGFRVAAEQAENVRVDVEQVADGDIPRAWEGTASEYASEVVAAVSGELGLVVDVFRDADKELAMLADSLQAAQQTDDAGSRLPSSRRRTGRSWRHCPRSSR